MEIYPPVKSLEFPLDPADVCEVLSISRSTLLRWEREGKTPKVNQIFVGMEKQRLYYEEDFLSLLKSMQKMQKPALSWINDYDFDLKGKLVTPSGYVVYT